MADLRLLILLLLLLPFQVSPSSFSSDLQTLQKDLNYTFKTLDLLRRAVTHPSYSLANYRSLSILGLSTIHSSVALDLLQTDPDADAKQLSRRIESFAGSAACAAAGARLGIERIVRVAAGTNMTAPAVVCGAFKGRNCGELTYEDLVIAKGVYEKGTIDEIEDFVYQLCDVGGDGVVGRSDLEAVLGSMYGTLFSTDNSQPCLSSHEEFMKVFLNAVAKEGEGLSSMDFKIWCRTLPSVRKFLGSLLTPPDSGRLGVQVPYMSYPENFSHDLLVLKKEYAWHIGGALSQPELGEWKLLYHSASNGLSFNTFMGSISSGDGPTVLIIKDTEGYIYGGYASQPWERQSDFYGDMKSFLFQLYPQASIFRPTGANNNLQWCAINFSSDSIPNGVGFGGRANHFGLFLSANFDQGHTFACTTFNSPCLSKTNQIHPEVIECWGIQVKGVQNEHKDTIKGTVLERFKEDQNMLKMVGLANSSE